MCDDEHEEEAKELPPIHHVLRDLPLFDNTYLNMQAMNIGLVDAHLEDLETRLLAKYHEIEKIPLIEAMLVSAHSQLWIFGLYELLRTWRQEARELMAYGEDLAKLKDKERETRIQREKARITKAESGNVFGKGHYSRHFAQLETDPKFLEAIKAAPSRLLWKIEKRNLWLKKKDNLAS